MAPDAGAPRDGTGICIHFSWIYGHDAADAMKLGNRNCLVCNCEGSMPIDPKVLSKALGTEPGTIHKQLCRAQLGAFETALAGGGPLLVACRQEEPLFREIAEESGKPDLVQFVNIRETAGWSADAQKAHPKIAALLAAAARTPEPARLKTILSDGLCLVYGAGQPALDAAKLLAKSLSVTLILSADEDIVPPTVSDVPVYRGQIVAATGSLGGFSLVIDNHAAMLPSSRDSARFAEARNGTETECSVILDLSGKTPLFAGHTHRDGYEWADPGNPAAVLEAIVTLSGMVGEFEKPLYVDYNKHTCAHSRSGKIGCSKCLDACPAGAIAESGDHVSLDSGICGGCGACHAVCPTGSFDYRYPRRSDLIAQGQTLLRTFRDAGGKAPVLLFADEGFGNEMIAALARYGRGLPANVIPCFVHAPTMPGHVEMMSLFAAGASRIVFLIDPKQSNETGGLETETALSNHILTAFGFSGTDRVTIICEADPDAVDAALWSLPPVEPVCGTVFEPAGSKRDVARLAFSALQAGFDAGPDLITLPPGAPYGRVTIDTGACTLCMACTSACPTGAMIDTPGKPRLRFIEGACVQCGICVSTCPESALTLEPRLDLSPGALEPVTLYEEEPFECIVCGKPFATRSTIERISAQLSGHSMYANPERARMIRMCDVCRIETQAEGADDPFSLRPRGRVRTTEDYLAAERGELSADDFLIDDE